MEFQRDFKELLGLFNSHKVEYLIIGAHALAWHGAPRYTGDLDLLVNPAAANAKKIMAALDKFGFGSLGLKAADFSAPGKVVQLGVPPVRVDILTSLTGLSWRKAAAGAVRGTYGGLRVRYLGKQGLIANKKALGRKKDLADIEAIGED
ncbi:MAG: hypothetical protein A3J79_00755 [Elusimicrobia bacterium RIFOXYB2_FULL_62_6]|nr:MAG: hypothetical protein A3J79_00755 [Elusimicrobia bacterium RIFOXYB2_FULL_62_6]